MLLDHKKIVSIILEKEKTEEKYSDAIASGKQVLYLIVMIIKQ